MRTPSAQWCQLFLPEMTPEQLPPAIRDDPPRYNIAPTQSIVCIYREAAGVPRAAMKTRWGLVPSWAKDLAIGNRMINARGETVDAKPSYRSAFASRRCLIPTDGYYEWKKTSDGKQPYLIESTDHGLLAMAGLWEENTKIADDATPIRTCTIITTAANKTTTGIHDRMPVFLDARDHEQWLDPGFRDAEKLKQLLVPAPEDLLTMTPVSRHVNSPKNEDEACVTPIA